MSSVAISTRSVAAPSLPPSTDGVRSLAIFDHIPVRHGVCAVSMDGILLKKGDVAVYDELALSMTEGLVDGGLYVVEYQSPRSGMSWELFRRFECTRVNVSREVIIAARSKHRPEHWYVHPICGSGAMRGGMIRMSDGPYRDEFHLMDKIIGEVVGVYRGRQFDVEVA
jgi:hypothetical protein